MICDCMTTQAKTRVNIGQTYQTERSGSVNVLRFGIIASLNLPRLLIFLVTQSL